MTTTLSQERDAPTLETHEDAVDLVKTVFKQMGGTVIPPKRPRHIPKYTPLTIEGDNFMMDFENACLSQSWDSRKRAHPRGPNRYKDPEWAQMIQSQVYPHHSDVDWTEYCNWCEAGGGDEVEETLYCTKHHTAPLDVWYDCDACCQEVGNGPKPPSCRYIWIPLNSVGRARSE
jgi:hypothetical protein